MSHRLTKIGGDRVDPFAVTADQVNQAVDGILFGDVEGNWRFADIEVNFVRGAADVAEVGIGHFAGAIDDAAHDGDAHSFEVAGGVADFAGGVLEVEQGAAAAWAGDVVGFKDAGAGGLEDVVGEAEGCFGVGFESHEDGIADAIAEQRAEMARAGDESVWAGSERRCEGVLKQDWVLGVQCCSQQAECGNDIDGGAVGHGDEAGVWARVDFRDGRFVVRIDRNHGGFFDDDFRFEISHGCDFGSQGVPVGLGGENADWVIATEVVTAESDDRGLAALIGKWVV